MLPIQADNELPNLVCEIEGLSFQEQIQEGNRRAIPPKEGNPFASLMPVRDDKTSEPFSTSCPALSPRCRHDPQLAISPRDPDFKQTSPCTLTPGLVPS